MMSIERAVRQVNSAASVTNSRFDNGNGEPVEAGTLVVGLGLIGVAGFYALMIATGADGWASTNASESWARSTPSRSATPAPRGP